MTVIVWFKRSAITKDIWKLIKLVHINVCFLNKNFDNLEFLLESTND